MNIEQIYDRLRFSNESLNYEEFIRSLKTEDIITIWNKYEKDFPYWLPGVMDYKIQDFLNSNLSIQETIKEFNSISKTFSKLFSIPLRIMVVSKLLKKISEHNLKFSLMESVYEIETKPLYEGASTFTSKTTINKIIYSTDEGRECLEENDINNYLKEYCINNIDVEYPSILLLENRKQILDSYVDDGFKYYVNNFSVDVDSLIEGILWRMPEEEGHKIKVLNILNSDNTVGNKIKEVIETFKEENK